jgi:hypothetical protein
MRKRRLTYRQRRARTQDRQGIALMIFSVFAYAGYLYTQVGL